MNFRVDKISISFGGLKAVSNFSLDLPSKGLYGLIGPNGAGKTTVFNLITGVYQADTGNLFIGETSLKGLPPFKIAKAGLVRTFQNIRLFKDLSVLQNVLIPYHMNSPYGYFDLFLRTRRFIETEKKWIDEARSLLNMIGLDDRRDDHARNLSYGNQKRLEIARALAGSPKVLFLDEPAAGLNSQEKSELMKLIAKIREQFHVSVLLIEHDMKLVMGICERITVLDHGETIAEGTPKQIQENPKVIEAYLGVG